MQQLLFMRSILHCPLSEVLLIHTKLWKRCYIPKRHIYKAYRTQRTVCRYWKSTDCSRAGRRVVKCTGLSKMRSSKKKNIYIMWVANIWRKFFVSTVPHWVNYHFRNFVVFRHSDSQSWELHVCLNTTYGNFLLC